MMLHNLLVTKRTKIGILLEDPIYLISFLLLIFGVSLLIGVLIYKLSQKKPTPTKSDKQELEPTKINEQKQSQPPNNTSSIQKDKKMFCKNCGKQIDEDSVFCQYCGSKQTINLPTNQFSKEDPLEQKQSSGLGTFFIVTCIIIVIVLCVIFCIQQIEESNSSSNNPTQSSQKSSSKLFSRNAKTSDIFIDAEYSFPVSINLIIRPYEDIDNLEITIQYLNKTGETIKIQQKTIGNVKEGQEYRIQINLTDFSISQIWNIENCKYTVSNGTVKLLN